MTTFGLKVCTCKGVLPFLPAATFCTPTGTFSTTLTGADFAGVAFSGLRAGVDLSGLPAGVAFSSLRPGVDFCGLPAGVFLAGTMGDFRGDVCACFLVLAMSRSDLSKQNRPKATLTTGARRRKEKKEFSQN